MITIVRKGENIYKRKDGRWEGRYVKARTVEKKIIYGSVYGKRYTDVKDKLMLIKANRLSTSFEFRRYEGTYEDWVGNWLSITVKRKVKPTTYSSYFRLLKRYILPVIGSRILSKLTEQEIQFLVDCLIRQGLAPSTVRLVLTLVKQSLNEAVHQKYLSSNPCEFVQLPKVRVNSVNALSKSEQRQLEQLAISDEACSPVLLALYSGMRIGEISGLQWQDIDFEQNLIRVKRTIVRVLDEKSPYAKTELLAAPPKTEGSKRVIPLAGNLKRYLLEKRKSATGPYVICSRKGMAEPRVINYRFKRLIQQTDFSGIHFHVLRHTFATRSLEQGMDIASLSKILGHRSTKLTLDTYADSLFEQRQKEMAKVDQLFLG